MHGFPWRTNSLTVTASHAIDQAAQKNESTDTTDAKEETADEESTSSPRTTSPKASAKRKAEPSDAENTSAKRVSKEEKTDA